MSAPPKKPSGMSLYADLLGSKQKADQAATATISGAPVRYTVPKTSDSDEAAEKKKDASLQFQPIRRPQAPGAKVNRPKQQPTSSSTHKFSSSTVTASNASASSPDKPLPANISSTPQQQPTVQRTKLEDWVGGDEDDEFIYQDNRPKHERGGRKKKKKGKGQETRVWDWDDIYDPTLPNNYADYKGSDEQSREIRDWKARLYYHKLKDAKKEKKAGMDAAYSDEKEEEAVSKPANRMFAPPPNLNFAPPSFNDAPVFPQPVDDDDDDYYPPSVPSRPADTSDTYEPAPVFAQASLPDDPTGDDAYMRRMGMSGAAPAPSFTPGPPQERSLSPIPMNTALPRAPPAGSDKAMADIAAKKAEAMAKFAAVKAKLANELTTGNGKTVSPTPSAPPNAPEMSHAQLPVSAQTQMAPPPPPVEDPAGLSVSRGPVLYQQPQPASDDAKSSSPTPEPTRSKAPGQKGFAERLLKKYGWEKGQGLGAQGEGITTAIVAKAEKRKKRSDAQGGGWAAPANMGKLVGGKRRKIESTGQDDGAFGAMSEVVKLEGMCKGMEDIDAEIMGTAEDGSGGLYEEIGREMEGQYGKVERIFIWRREVGGGDDVFVKFTSQLSALRAVNATDGMEFNGQSVKARFFDPVRFEAGEYA